MAAHEVPGPFPFYTGGRDVLLGAAGGCGPGLLAWREFLPGQAGSMGAISAAHPGVGHLLGGTCGEAVRKSSRFQAASCREAPNFNLRIRFSRAFGRWVLE